MGLTAGAATDEEEKEGCPNSHNARDWIFTARPSTLIPIILLLKLGIVQRSAARPIAPSHACCQLVHDITPPATRPAKYKALSSLPFRRNHHFKRTHQPHSCAEFFLFTGVSLFLALIKYPLVSSTSPSHPHLYHFFPSFAPPSFFVDLPTSSVREATPLCLSE